MLFIFDLDGTLADLSHRRKYVEGSPKNWAQFFAECKNDAPKKDVISLLELLAQAGAEVRVWSGRPEHTFEATRQWLTAHVKGGDSLPLRMRPSGDFRPDTEVKQGWLDALTPSERKRLSGIFDDRDSVVAMWRANGVTCLQVDTYEK
jgi:FMN phosphatase YigB (HAD superfamily)